MIDALFGSKTRVKLLHLFMNNLGQSFYVREITRIIDEQINSVRRELSNMLEVGVITCDSSDNKLFYQVNQRYQYYVPLRTIFADNAIDDSAAGGVMTDEKHDEGFASKLNGIAGVRLALFAGILTKGSSSSVDLLVAGNMDQAKVKGFIKEVEKRERREINYSIMSYDEFYYRLSVRDKFITNILDSKHKVVIDSDHILKK